MSKQGRDHNRTERAAAIRAQQQRKENLRKVGLVAGIVVVLGAIIAAGVIYSSGSGSDKKAPTSKTPARVGDHSLIVGKASAPTKVVVYEDFQCPYCREFEMSSRDFLHEYAQKGKVQVEYRPFNLLQQLPYSARALDAFIAVLEHGTPAQALALHDTFYDNQPYEQQSSSISTDQIRKWVEDTGAPSAAVDAISEDHKAWFDAATKAALDAGVKGTPTVMVDGKVFGQGMSVGQMADALEKKIAQG